MDCGSGLPAANRFIAGRENRGWKAAPTIIAVVINMFRLPIFLAGNNMVCTSLNLLEAISKMSFGSNYSLGARFKSSKYVSIPPV